MSNTITTTEQSSASAASQPSGELRAGGGEATLEERVTALEEAIDRLNAHAAQLQGAVSLLGFQAAIDIIGRVRAAENPYHAIEKYIETVVHNGRKLQAPAETGEWREYVQSGINGALDEHIALLTRLSQQLPGAPSRPHA